MKRIKNILLSLILVCCLIFPACDFGAFDGSSSTGSNSSTGNITLADIPEYTNRPYVEINGNQPEFTAAQMTTVSYEFYSELDVLGRCGYTMACVGIDIMPTEERGDIGSVKPTGWQSVKYDIVDGKYLYNRCHLIGFQLTGENANRRNLITGTRYMNVDGMLPFENMVADYVQETENHVLYRVTPIFIGNNLVAHGVQMEAYSVEDEGEEICFNVYVYNVQPGIVIDYATGESRLSGTPPTTAPDGSDGNNGSDEGEMQTFVLNTNTKRYHKPTCSSVSDMNPANKDNFTGTKAELEGLGYVACGSCKP